MNSAARCLTFVLLAPLALAACDSTDGDENASTAEHGEEHGEEHGTETHGDEHGTETHGDDTDTDTEGQGDCASEERDDEFSIGLTKMGALTQASFVSADPAPPFKGDNTWILDISDLAGEPLEGVEIVVIPMMPDHGHGTPIEALVAATETPGRYEVTPVNLFMTGLWEITFELTLAGGEQDSLMFGFCVE